MRVQLARGPREAQKEVDLRVGARGEVTLAGSGFSASAKPFGDASSATLKPAFTPSFPTSGLPDIRSSGATGFLSGLAIALGSAVLMRPHVV